MRLCVTYIRELIEQEPDGDWKFTVVLCICLITKQIKELRIHERGDEVKCGVGVADDNEQCGFPVADGVKPHFVITHNLA